MIAIRIPLSSPRTRSHFTTVNLRITTEMRPNHQQSAIIGNKGVIQGRDVGVVGSAVMSGCITIFANIVIIIGIIDLSSLQNKIMKVVRRIPTIIACKHIRKKILYIRSNPNRFFRYVDKGINELYRIICSR